MSSEVVRDLNLAVMVKNFMDFLMRERFSREEVMEELLIHAINEHIRIARDKYEGISDQLIVKLFTDYAGVQCRECIHILKG